LLSAGSNRDTLFTDTITYTWRLYDEQGNLLDNALSNNAEFPFSYDNPGTYLIECTADQ
jgi:hypothetical protein